MLYWEEVTRAYAEVFALAGRAKEKKNILPSLAKILRPRPIFVSA
jgi:hypothetical protein